MKECVIEAYLVNCVKALGGEVRKVTWPGRRGAPDRFIMLPERWKPEWQPTYLGSPMKASAIWVELKAPGVKAEPHQLREHDRMRAMGQRVEVIDSLEGVDRLLA